MKKVIVNLSTIRGGYEREYICQDVELTNGLLKLKMAEDVHELVPLYRITNIRIEREDE